jgi:RhtX/FptX family siderophore transporter
MTRRLEASTAAKLTLLGSLYFSQGLPFGFFTQALPAMLRAKGVSLGEIGLSSLLAVPWALKFVWAPVVDRVWWRWAGRRTSWIVPLQLASAVLLLALGTLGLAEQLPPLLAAVFLLNLFAATQDIATDGLAVDLLAARERGLANGLQVAGYRAGMIVGGGVLLLLHDRLGGNGTFLAMGALTLAATLPVLWVREPEAPAPAARADSSAWSFFRRPEARRILTVLVTYKAGEAFATGMLRPFLTDAGLTLADLGWLLGTVGFVAGLAGALAGGALVNRLGRRTALVSFGLLQALTVAGYAVLASGPMSRALLTSLCAAEHFAGGMATAALFTAMMDWSSTETSATDYTIQASAVVIATGAASALAGFSAQALGYAGHFTLATALALGAVAVVQRTFPSSRPTSQEVPSCASPSTPAPSTP